MSKLEQLIKELCPNGVEYKSIKSAFQRIKGTPITAEKMKEIESTDGNIRVFAGGKTAINAKEEDIPNANITRVPAVLVQSRGVIDVIYFNAPFTFKNEMWAYTTNEQVTVKYLFYILKSNLQKLRDAASGMGSLPQISLPITDDLRIPLPPLPVQEEIVKILDNFTELTAELIAELTAELTARKQQLDFYRNGVIENTKGEKGKLIDLLSQPITDGPHTTPEFVSEGIPFISATAVFDGQIHLDKAQGFITKNFDDECGKKYKPKKYDIYMVKSGSTTGKVAFVDSDYDFNIWSPLAAMRAKNKITARYIYHLLQTTNVQTQVLTRMSHGSQPNLSMRVLEQFDVNIPQIEDQKKIIDVLDRFDILCNNISEGLPAEIKARQQQYEYYRDKLLTFKEKEVCVNE